MILERLFAHEGFSARGAVVVAHPDDEALWFGGLMICYPIQWTVICCSIPRMDPVRALKFYDSCAILGAEGRVIPIEEEPSNMPIHYHAIGMLEAHLAKANYDVIVTHGVLGEYGHLHHQILGYFVANSYPRKTMRGCYGDADGPFVFDLMDSEIERKTAAIMAYDHRSIQDGGKTKGEALMRRYGEKFNLWRETYVGPE